MILNLQFLRAVAALMIVMIHLQVLLVPLGYHQTIEAFYPGVDLFFVISGFIMTYVVDRRRVSASDFIVDRLIRIVPIYWLATMVLFLGTMIIPVHTMAPPTLAGLAGSLAFLPVCGTAPQFLPILLVGWTLNLEMYFYAVFALGLASRLRQDVRLAATGAVIVGVCLAVTALPVESHLRFYGLPIACEFGIGMLIARCKPWIDRLPVAFAGTLGIVGIGALIARSWYPADHTSLAYGPPAALIVSAAVALEGRGARIGGRMVALVADASYVLYVSHPLVMALFINVQRLSGVLQRSPGAQALWLAAFASAIGFALAVHRWIERPLLEWLRGATGAIRLGARSGRSGMDNPAVER